MITESLIDIENKKRSETVQHICDSCSKVFTKTKQEVIKKNGGYLAAGMARKTYCCKECAMEHKKPTEDVTCKLCEKKLIRQISSYTNEKSYFCCRSHAAIYNNRHRKWKHNDESKAKISESLKKAYSEERGKLKERNETRNARKEIISNKICICCGKQFKTNKSNKTCSKECKSQSHSNTAIKRLLKEGFNTPFSQKFNYNEKEYIVDSILEKAAIIYLTDALNATRIERFSNIINYTHNNITHKYNPDFICEINTKTTIVEVKLPYIKNKIFKESKIEKYNSHIPAKQKALKEFCENKNYDMLWLTTENPHIKQIYRRIRKEK